jgi:hypothetical protein
VWTCLRRLKRVTTAKCAGVRYDFGSLHLIICRRCGLCCDEIDCKLTLNLLQTKGNAILFIILVYFSAFTVHLSGKDTLSHSWDALEDPDNVSDSYLSGIFESMPFSLQILMSQLHTIIKIVLLRPQWRLVEPSGDRLLFA